MSTTASSLLQPAGPTADTSTSSGAIQPAGTDPASISGGMIQPAGGINYNTGDTVPWAGGAVDLSLGATTSNATTDPWAGTPWGSKAAYDQAINGYQESKNATMGSVNDAITNNANTYQSGILDFLDQLRSGQQGIDRNATQAEMKREQGRLGVMDMVGTGVRSGGVTLNNSNSANSSAGDAIARAWAEMGRKELTKSGTTYALDMNNVKTQQEQLANNTATFKRHAEENKVLIANSIVSDAANKIAALNASAINASLPDRLNIETEKERIKQQALAELTKFDSTLNGGVDSIKASTQNTRRGEASRLLTSGTAPDTTGTMTTDVPQNLQGTGPFPSPLPIFVSQKRPEDQTTPLGA